MTFLNLIEPEALIKHFIAHPPRGFVAGVCAATPYFAMRFDVLTTADEPVRARLQRLPLYRRWGSALCLMSSFVGTTVSEYVVLPAGVPPRVMLDRLLDAHAARHPLTVIKDIPTQSPLIDAASNRYAADLAAECRSRGCVLISGQALAYVPLDFASIEQYFRRLSSQRRRDFRRKLRKRSALQIEAVPTGSPVLRSPQVLAELYALYVNVYRQSAVQFDLLSAEFFTAVLQDAACDGVVFTYRHQGELIGYNLCFVRGGKLIDKYVGFRYPQARDFNLYFVSWFQNLEYALARGLEFYVAGWTDPEVKRSLGARFTWTRHAVYPRSRVLRASLPFVRRYLESDEHWHRKHSPDAPAHT